MNNINFAEFIKHVKFSSPDGELFLSEEQINKIEQALKYTESKLTMSSLQDLKKKK